MAILRSKVPRSVARRFRFDFRKAAFVLPNAFTMSSIFCGLYAILQSSGEPDSAHFYRAALAIFFGSFFDAMDGRVARLTKTQSEFGVELDSLADLVTFGVAPSILVYRWGLEPLGDLALVAVFIYTGAGAARLARFNVMAHREQAVSAHFIGLPIPLAAATIVSLVIAHHSLGSGPVVKHGSVLAVVLILSYLMVSNVRYPTFKGVGLSWRPMAAIGAVLATLIISFGVLGVSASLMLIVLCGGYLLFGLLAEVLFFNKRKQVGQAEAVSSEN